MVNFKVVSFKNFKAFELEFLASHLKQDLGFRALGVSTAGGQKMASDQLIHLELENSTLLFFLHPKIRSHCLWIKWGGSGDATDHLFCLFAAPEIYFHTKFGHSHPTFDYFAEPR